MLRRTVVGVAGLALLVGACGDDDEDAGDEYCDVAQELAESDDFDDDLLDRYLDVAPDEIRDDAALAIEAIKEDGEAAFEDPEVLAAVEDIETFESDECGIGGEDDDADEGDDTTTTEVTEDDDVDTTDPGDDEGDDTTTTTAAEETSTTAAP